MHYGEVEKWGEKWSTLTNYFSADFHREFVKYCTKLSELLKKIEYFFCRNLRTFPANFWRQKTDSASLSTFRMYEQN